MNQSDFWTLDHDRLAADYCAAIRSQLTDAQILKVNTLNAAEHDSSVDHVHDFTDANECMMEALTKQNQTLLDCGPETDATWRRCRDHNYQLRRVLIACEFSAIARNAVAAFGHDVISCDTLPTEQPGKHYQGDVRDIMNDGFTDILAFPPCTYLCNSGVKHLVRNGVRIDPQRWQDMRDGAEFFIDLGAAPADRIMRENPIMHCYAKEIIGRGPDQYVNPYQYGHDHSKKTGLYLDGLPLLTNDPADHVAPRIITYRGRKVKRWSNQSPCGADATPPSSERWRIRSRFFAGIANAMAAQWFNPLTI